MSQEENGKSEEAGMQTEVVAKAKRRQHPAEYKLRILKEVDECKGKGEVGALLRREGLYSSLVSKWREQRERGGLTGLSEHRRGPKVDANAVELVRLQRENKRLQEQLQRAELIIDVQKKVARLLGVPLSDSNPSTGSGQRLNEES
jgi:transposase